MKRMFFTVALAAAATVAFAADTIDLKGTYTWNPKKDKVYEVTAVVTPEAGGTMGITYDTTWGKKPRTYVGKITGNLKNGKISGTAITKGGKRNWVVRGKAQTGVITSEHNELKTKGDKIKEIHTGTVTLQR
jgi:hypothetical protein